MDLKGIKQTSAWLTRRSASSADYQFAVASVLHLQRMATMRAATAASELGGECLLWAALSELILTFPQQAHQLTRRLAPVLHWP